MTDLRELARVELPVVQAGMGGGISGHALAAAVSEAGGLGTVCTLPPQRMRAEIEAVRERTANPVAVNLLLPFARRAHAEAAEAADVAVTFWGRPERPVTGVWIHQCGSVDEALEAVAAGADGVIAQGVEAGGHVRGAIGVLELTERVRAAVPSGTCVLAAGGMADAADVREALAAGASAAVLGTRFVLSEESNAHPGYRACLIEATETVRTELFGLGWPAAPHRVVPNAATRRWLGRGDRGPGWVRLAEGIANPVLSRVPAALQERMGGMKRALVPFLDPMPPNAGSPDRLVDAAPLYAGTGVARIGDVRPAAELVRELAP